MEALRQQAKEGGMSTAEALSYVPGRVALEDTYTETFPNGIPCLVLAHPERDMGGDYPEPLMDEETARIVGALISQVDFVSYRWVGATMIEHRAAGFWNDEAEVSIVGPDPEGMYAVGHGLLWETLPRIREGLCRFRHERA